MPKEPDYETPKAEVAYFRIRVHRLIEAGALDPGEADAALAGFLERAAKRRAAGWEPQRVPLGARVSDAEGTN